MPGLLTLDIASMTGWAHKARPDAPPTYGSVQFEGTSKNMGRFLWYFRRWQMAIMARLDPDQVWYESPFVGNPAAVAKMYALAGQVELNCIDHGLSRDHYGSVTANQWRPRFLGPNFVAKAKGRAARREELKFAVIAQCEAFGWSPQDDNQGDALGILDYRVAKTWPTAAVAGAPLLGAWHDENQN